MADTKKIQNDQMTASSYYNNKYYPYYGRLSGTMGKGWCPKTRQGPRTDYLQIDMRTVRSVCAVATQGSIKASEWTSSYILRMSIDGETWDTYKQNNAEKVR